MSVMQDDHTPERRDTRNCRAERNRLGRRYRVMWDQNIGPEGLYHPPISRERVAQAYHGSFEGRPVDAYVCTVGSNAGYTLDWPTQVPGAEFIVDRLNAGAKVGRTELWRKAENVRLLWEHGLDPIGISVETSIEMGIDHWFRLSMNDWHHLAGGAAWLNLQAGSFYTGHPEYRIGEAGARGWPEKLAEDVQWFQDWMHPEVRALRLGIAVEALQRYAATGFLYDFMRCPCYFKRGEEEAGAEVMTGFIRETRASFDAIAQEKQRPVGLAVRVPNTIGGAERLGFDVRRWVAEGLIDILIPSCFFGQDTEEDITEWVELVRDSQTLLNPAIEEGYEAGHTGDFQRWYFQAPIMTPMSVEMIRALAAKHLARGADGLFLFNFFGTSWTYNYDNREAVDDVADPVRLKHKDKTYVVMRSHDSFPNCLQTEHQIPAPVTADPLTIEIDVADDLAPAGDRMESVRLRVHYENLTVYDEVEVSINGHAVPCLNPFKAGGFAQYPPTTWLQYDLDEQLPSVGRNQVGLRMERRNERLADELPVTVEDLELEVRYAHPNGRWHG